MATTWARDGNAATSCQTQPPNDKITNHMQTTPLLHDYLVTCFIFSFTFGFTNITNTLLITLSLTYLIVLHTPVYLMVFSI